MRAFWTGCPNITLLPAADKTKIPALGRVPNRSRQRGGAPTAENTDALYEPDPVRAKILAGYSFGQHAL
jgi:hypothetical protein